MQILFKGVKSHCYWVSRYGLYTKCNKGWRKPIKMSYSLWMALPGRLVPTLHVIFLPQDLACTYCRGLEWAAWWCLVGRRWEQREIRRRKF